MPVEHQPTIESLSHEIRAYLEQHPRRMDSLTGIVNWWWEFERYREVSKRVEAALGRLIEEGVVGTRTLGNEMLYFLRGGADRD